MSNANKDPKDYKRKRENHKARLTALKFLVLIIFVGGILIFGSVAFPYIRALTKPDMQSRVVEIIRGKGIWGVLYLLLVQIYQVVIFIIPGEVVEIAAGILYGMGVGFVICSTGVAIGSIIIYKTVKFLGYDLISNLAFAKKFQELSFLKHQDQLDRLVFILFLIPGTPKDALTYFIPFTKMPLKRFIIISGVARIPSILSSTYAGELLARGHIAGSVTMFIIIAVAAVIGIAINRLLMAKYND